MENIRKAEARDISRIAEILVFNKRINYRSIFRNDDYSFGELQVLTVAKEYMDNINKLERTWVYADGFVKGIIEIDGKRINTLYVEHFFQGNGIGAALLDFAVKEHGSEFLWALEKNVRAIAFYERNGFHFSGEKIFEEGTTEYLVKLQR